METFNLKPGGLAYMPVSNVRAGPDSLGIRPALFLNLEHKAMNQYFDRVECKWLPMPAKVYVANLPIALDVPALRYHELIVHKTIGKAPKDKAWTVTHKDTSFAIAKGRTRTEAMTNAQEVILRHGNDRFLSAIEGAKKQISVLMANH